jgi:hypothetical protein
LKGNNYIFAEDLTILPKELFIKKSEGCQVFGNSSVLFGKTVKYPSVPDPLFIAKWAAKFGENRKTLNYDFLEPNYLKNFILKEKK